MGEFRVRVYRATKRIPKGRVATYAAIAKVVGSPRAARAVGNALNQSPFRSVPCHRVIRSDGTVGGFARGGRKKIQLLRREGVVVNNGRINLKPYRARI